jgi:D-3-phosphoglycerate dehydrogenase
MKVLVSDKSAEEALQVFKDANHELTYDEMDHETLLKEIPKYDALMVRSRTKVKTEIVEAGAKGNLKVIGRAGIGVDNIDIETAGKLGIKVVNSPTGSTKSVAELAIGHMLSLVRYIPKADSSMKKGEWIKKQLKGKELYGKILGLIGSGYIAQHVSKIANGIGMKVLVYSPHCTDEKAKKMGATRKDLNDLLKQSDFVSLHIPHTKDSHYLLNEKTLGLMKDGAYLINASRGGVVEEEALYKVLKEEKLAGAAVDVFEQEPPSKDNVLLTLDNVILSPHLGANTKEAQIQAGTVCADQMNKVLNGEDPDFWVNKKFM